MDKIIDAESASVFWQSGVSRYGSTENIRVIPIIISEFEFRDTQRQIFAADLMEAPHDAASSSISRRF
jgi:hypothetical protein